jgi:toxin ParE1/3/4
MSIIWSARAQANLYDIVGYIAKDDPVAGQRLADGIIDGTTAMLTGHPKAGRAGRVENTREWVAHKHYIVVYRIKRDIVTILAVRHTSLQ